MIRFYLPHQQLGEKIILLIRRHWLVLFLRLGLWFLMIALPPLLLILGFKIENYFNNFLQTLVVLFFSLYYLYLWLFMLNSFIDYYLDVWIVTNERIINIEQKQLFSRVTSEQKLARVQDVTAEVQGILPTFFNFGNVHIQTAGEQVRFIFKQVPRPNEVARKISNLAEFKRRYQKVKEELEEENQ